MPTVKGELPAAQRQPLQTTRRPTRATCENADGMMDLDSQTVNDGSLPAVTAPLSKDQSEDGNNPRGSIDAAPSSDTASGSHHSPVPPPPDSNGLKMVGHRVKILVDAIADFRDLGVNHVVDLPELVLCGDQSAGKSSLMGALTDIHLPRDAGTCTRCPTHIKTSPAGAWTCEISLHQSYMYEPSHGKLLPTGLMGRNPFPPWTEQPLKIRPFMTIRDRRHLEEALRWAQCATLNHDTDYHQYIPGSETFVDDKSTEADFSPNVVSIEVSGPDLPALSFYDLPGTISTTPTKETGYLVKMVENLVTKYIKHPRAIVICALPMSADAALSRTLKVIRDHNAEERCIGVLTKPDILPDGDFDENSQFARILDGKDHHVGHGYFVTKQPRHQTEINADFHKLARLAEEEFFDTKMPWTTEWQRFRDRCGTSRLLEVLSQKFAFAIANSIPSIKVKIDERAHRIDAELEVLPELPKERMQHAVSHQLAIFSTSLQQVLAGDQGNREFQSNWNNLCHQFCTAILEMRPRITLSHPSDGVLPEVILLDSDDSNDGPDETPDDTPTRVRKRRNEEPLAHTPVAKMRVGNGEGNRARPQWPPQWESPGLSAGTDLTPNQESTPRRPRMIKPPRPVELLKDTPFARFAPVGKRFASLDSIRDLIKKKTTHGIPGTVPREVNEKLCLDSVEAWKGPMEVFLEQTTEDLRVQADAILRDVLSKWQQTQLHKESRRLLSEFLGRYEIAQAVANHELYELEQQRILTINDIAFNHHRDEEGRTLRMSRKMLRIRAVLEKDIRFKNKLMSDGQRKAAEKQAEAQLGRDPFEAEMNVAIDLRGYYKTAALRFADSVCLSTNGKLFRGVRNTIFFYLEKALGITQGDGEERCRQLMEENTEIGKKREGLLAEKDRLARFTSRLVQLANEEAALDAELRRGNPGTMNGA
ncbi:MAG: hypothetical protein M1818_003306 [Claussenomyces sp. TS43310]|nr:MAG: hypothetical protein M1818_003306 [Claussenomyces sp. TS43310]